MFHTFLALVRVNIYDFAADRDDFILLRVASFLKVPRFNLGWMDAEIGEALIYVWLNSFLQFLLLLVEVDNVAFKSHYLVDKLQFD